MSRRRRKATHARPITGSTEQPARRYPIRVILCVFAALFATLAVNGFWNTSATWDEPIHLTAGYAALTQQDFRVDPSHPPLLRVWAALPVLALGPITMNIEGIDTPASGPWLQDVYALAHRFMYVDNDADRMLRAARAMVVALGLLLGVLVFCWAYEWAGPFPAIVALALFVVEPNIVTHASLVTTDLGVTTFVFGAVYFLWRCCRRLTAGNVAALAACCGLAIASKFSAVLLAPVLAMLLVTAAVRRTLTWRAAGAIAAIVTIATVTILWASYGFRYLPSESPTWAFDFTRTEFGARAPGLAAAVAWLDDHRLLPNAYTQGFLYSQASSPQLASFLAGEHSSSGWWYYFPVAFLIKTPIALILLLAIGLTACVVHGRSWTAGSAAFVAVPIAVFLGVAMYSGINIGLRHILPIYPFVLLIAALAAKALMSTRTRLGPAALAVLLVAGTAEFAGAYPHTLPFFNHFVGGSANGYKYLADSNLDWGQDLKPLKKWMSENDVSHINLAYFGQADPAYYGIDCTHLPGAPSFAIDTIARPRLPGYVAISPTILQGVYARPSWRLWYQPFVDLEPAAVIGNSLRIYWVDEWPEAVGAAGRTSDPEAHRSLADALLFGLQWPQQAIAHYREHLQMHPGDADGLLNLGRALVESGTIVDAIPPLQRAVELRPDDGPARLTLARVLFAHRDTAGAGAQAEAAVRLLPNDPDALDFLGRVRAAEGRFEAAAVAFRQALTIDPAHAAAREHTRRLAGMP